jgi:hypothetical protein
MIYNIIFFLNIFLVIIIFIILYLIFINNENFEENIENTKQNPKIVICLLSVRPDKLTYDFYKKIKLETNYEVIIIIDDNDYNIPDYDGVIKIIKINNQECEDAGYKGSVLYFPNKAVSRDKALYYFSKDNIEYDYVWFIEEDVFIPETTTIKKIDNKYPTGDLLVSANEIINQKNNDWHWNYVFTQTSIEPPYSKCMICAIRCSKKLINVINNYVSQYKSLFLDEALFNTLSIHNNLEIKTIEELKNMTYNYKWDLSEIEKDKLYHPIKSIEYQYFIRNNILS